MKRSNSYINFKLNKTFLIGMPCLLWGMFILISIFSDYNLFAEIKLFGYAKNYSLSRYLTEIIIYFLGNTLIFIVPGLLWAFKIFKGERSIYEILFFSFLTSFCILVICTSLYKSIFNNSLNNYLLLFIIVATTILGMINILLDNINIPRIFTVCKRDLSVILTLFIVLVTCIWIFQDKVLWVNVDNNFSQSYILSIPLGQQGDILEYFGLVDSLKTYILPYWDLEYANKFGYSIIDPPLQVFVSLFLTLFLGGSYAIVSITSLVVVAITFFISLKLVFYTNSIRRGRGIYYTIIPIVFICYFLIMISHAESSVTLINYVHFVSFFTIAQYYYLLKQNQKMFLLLALLSFLTKYEGALFSIFGIAFYHVVFRANINYTLGVVKKYLKLVLPYIVLMITIGLFDSNLHTYAKSIMIERFIRLDYIGIVDQIFPKSSLLWNGFALRNSWILFQQFMIASGLLGLFIFFPQKYDKTNIFLKCISILYFCLIMCSKVQRVHYISPLIFLTVIIALRTIMRKEAT